MTKRLTPMSSIPVGVAIEVSRVLKNDIQIEKKSIHELYIKSGLLQNIAVHYTIDL
jgi:hypothetical protein